MRVIAGSLRGRRLRSPSWPGLRPTGDKLRGAVFNILGPRIPGGRVLDGYAGTGAAGIEALSRGAADVIFVERDRRAVALIEDNLARCGIREGYAIIRASFVHAVEMLSAHPKACEPAARLQPDASGIRQPGAHVSGLGRFDVILLDPPYGWREDPAETVIAGAGALMTRDGVMALEHARRDAVPAAAGRLVRTRVITAGDSAVTFYACQP